MLIDATLKENFPPISLPKREYMERAKVIWDELGLPALEAGDAVVRLFAGRMARRIRAAAQRAVKGEYFETGAELAKRRRNDVRINTEVRDLKPPAPKKK